MDKKVSSENDDDQQEDEYDGESEDELEEEEEDQDEDEDEEDKQEEKSKLAKASKKKGEEKGVFGIPDGSDSEISDFEVEENDEDDDDEEEEGENGYLDDEDGGDIDDEEDEDDERDEKSDEIDSDEVDEDLVDLYQDLGDEKKALGIGKPTKPFEDIDFDREDFYNDLQTVNNEGEKSEMPIKKKQEVKQSKDLFNLADDDDGETDATKTNGDKLNDKSTYELRKEKLKETVEKIHDSMLKNVSDKPWQLKGEITAKERPLDSLLQEYVDFDHTTRQAPVMDANSSEALEAMIKNYR
jgi:U3 small nucleolar RNA-associated protein MPP10